MVCEMRKIMLDMDDVMTNGTFHELLEKYLGHKFDYNLVKGYRIQDALGDKKEDFFKLLAKTNLYDGAELFQDCYDVLKKLSEYYEIHICTDYIWPEIIEAAGDNLKNKYDFLYNELEFLNPRNYIFTADKSIVNCDIRIDDKISNLNVEGAEIKLLFTAYHNKDITDEELSKQNIVRVNNWKEIEQILLKGI